MNTSTCSAPECGAAIIWTVTEGKGKRMPVNAQPAPDGNLVISESPHGAPISKVADLLDPDGPRYLSHFVSCPAAGEFRRR